MKESPFEFGTEPAPIGKTCQRWGSYVVTDLSVEDEKLVNVIAGCINKLLQQARESIKRNNLDVIEESMEFIVKKNPNWEARTAENIMKTKPMGTVAIKYLALNNNGGEAYERREDEAEDAGKMPGVPERAAEDGQQERPGV